MSNETPQTNTSVDDRVASFAHAVLAGEIVAGPNVRNACKRHLRDVEHGPARGLIWVQELADRAIGFFEDVLCLNGGEYEGKPFLLAPWQTFVVGSLFGWMTEDGFRRFRLAYIETGKGSGKSPLVGGIGLYGLVSDGEQRAEVYAAATKRDQAMILFRDAVSMVNMSPLLSERLLQSGRDEKVWNLFYPNTNSFFRPISADEGQSGPRPHIGLLDELHEHKTATTVNMMRAGIAPAPAGERFTLTERQSLLTHGIATASYSGGAQRIERGITSYQRNAFDQSDDSYLDSESLHQSAYVISYLKSVITSKYGRHKLANDGTRFGAGQAIVTPNVIRGELMASYYALERLGIVENADAFAQYLVVERSATNPNRLNVLFPPDLVNQLWLLSRRTLVPDTLKDAEAYANEALAWLVDDGVLTRVTVTAERQGNDRMNLRVMLIELHGETLELNFNDTWGLINGV